MRIQRVFKMVVLLWLGAITGCGQTRQNKQPIATINVGKGPDALFLTPSNDYLYVANVEDTFITVIDTKTDSVIKTISMQWPWGFTRLGQSNLLAVSGYGGDVSIIDFSRHEIIKSKRIESALGGITSSSSGNFIYVNAVELNKAFKLSASDLRIVNEYRTGSKPDGIALTADDRKLYVTNTQDGTISIIDETTGASKMLYVGGKPELIHMPSDRSKIFISNFDDNKVHVIDPTSDSIITDITGLEGPEDVSLSGDQTTMYVVNFNTSEVITFDAATYSRREGVYRVGNKPIGVVVLDDGKLYVSNYGDNSLTVIKK